MAEKKVKPSSIACVHTCGSIAGIGLGLGMAGLDYLVDTEVANYALQSVAQPQSLHLYSSILGKAEAGLAGICAILAPVSAIRYGISKLVWDEQS